MAGGQAWRLFPGSLDSRGTVHPAAPAWARGHGAGSGVPSGSWCWLGETRPSSSDRDTPLGPVDTWFLSSPQSPPSPWQRAFSNPGCGASISRAWEGQPRIQILLLPLAVGALGQAPFSSEPPSAYDTGMNDGTFHQVKGQKL